MGGLEGWREDPFFYSLVFDYLYGCDFVRDRSWAAPDGRVRSFTDVVYTWLGLFVCSLAGNPLLR